MNKLREELDQFIPTATPGEYVRVCDWVDEDCYLLCLSFYNNMNTSPNLGWKNKFRHIWRILTKGSPYSDEVVFDIKSLEKLNKIIYYRLKRAKGMTNGKQ